jgi:hypothetical protein
MENCFLNMTLPIVLCLILALLGTIHFRRIEKQRSKDEQLAKSIVKNVSSWEKIPGLCIVSKNGNFLVSKALKYSHPEGYTVSYILAELPSKEELAKIIGKEYRKPLTKIELNGNKNVLADLIEPILKSKLDRERSKKFQILQNKLQNSS